MAGKIFINYRRGDDAGFTQALFQRLEDEFTAQDLFMDVEGHIRPGDDFVEVLNRQVARCDVLLAVIGPRWVELLTARGGDPDDFVAIELKAALEAGKRVIPVLVGGAGMPRADALPEPIRALARRNAVGLRPERFKADCQGLVTALKEQLAAAEHERAARSETERAAAEAERKRREAEEAARLVAAEQVAKEQRAAGLSAEEIRKAEELANWEFIKERFDAQALRDHLARFPGGVTALYATTKLEELVWAGLGAAPEAAELRAFVDEFPKGAHAEAVRTKLADHEKRAAEAKAVEQRRAAETTEWGAVAAGTDKAKIEMFLAKWPKGEHAAAARARLKELKGGRFTRRGVMKAFGLGAGVTMAAGAGAIATFEPGMPIWRLLNDRSVRTLDGHDSNVICVAISPDGDKVVTGSYDNTARIWDAKTGAALHVLKAHSDAVADVTVTPDATRVITASYDRTIRVWDIRSGKELSAIGSPSKALSVKLMPNGKSLVVGGYDGRVHFFDLRTGTRERSFQVHDLLDVGSVAVSPDGTRVVTGCFKAVQIWDAKTGAKILSLEGHTNSVSSIGIISDGSRIVSGSKDDTMRLWDANTGAVLQVTKCNQWEVQGVAFTPDHKHVLTAGTNSTTKVWDAGTGAELRTLIGHSWDVHCIAVSPDGRWAVSGSKDDTAKIWDIGGS